MHYIIHTTHRHTTHTTDTQTIDTPSGQTHTHTRAGQGLLWRNRCSRGEMPPEQANPPGAATWSPQRGRISWEVPLAWLLSADGAREGHGSEPPDPGGALPASQLRAGLRVRFFTNK